MFDKIKYQRDKRHRRKEWAIKLMGEKCLKCGSVDRLEFHHTRDKLFDISKILHRSIAAIISELEKCELLCRRCHDEKRKTAHGSLRMYSGHKCRCELCRLTWNSHSAEYRRNRRRLGSSVGRAQV